MDKNQVTMWMARDENGKLAVYDSKPDCLPEGARTRVRHL